MGYVIFLTAVFVIAGIVIWCFLSFHNVLSNRRFLNAAWGRIHRLLMGRNEMMAHFQENWAAPAKPTTVEGAVATQPSQADESPYITAFQDLLAEDATEEWDDVVLRREIRVELEDVAHKLFSDVLAKPEILNDGEFNRLRLMLEENSKALNQEVKGFNKIVARYNLLLLQTPNQFMARHFGASTIDNFPIEFKVF
ncbi:MAG: hypothetical protein FJX23_01965 [Alphaproteobacteria bacterium]|nr:hypothetical protein [Alphaproteobacteria bacterium]